jgi:hypothetical protein
MADLVLWFTGNPKWHENEDDSIHYAEDNGVEQDRTFKEKLALFLNDLRSGHYFNGHKLAYIVHVVEFQWRK